jgi:tetratricopeptide (TPR) repeat protein
LKTILVFLVVLALLGAAAQWYLGRLNVTESEAQPEAETHAALAHYVGGETCTGCHAEVATAWRGSHHDLAMDHATEASVLGRFDGSTITAGEITSTLYREGDRYMVRTEAADGSLRAFEIRYTFGVEPLQQYLVEFPDGRIQALPIAWDSRAAEAGGQRWFHLYADEPPQPGHPLHWTGVNQNWNHMCASCHSTNLRKGYDPVADRFRTTWSDIDVSCEACHGPGSTHLTWAKQLPGWESIDANAKGLDLRFDERTGANWVFAEGHATAKRSRLRSSEKEITACAPCHSRRDELVSQPVPGAAFGDGHRLALLDADLYFPDGQIRDEVFVYGSYIQSRMYHAGVTCSDCHDPHSLELKYATGPPLSVGRDGVCLQCHRADVYASQKHHFHPIESAGARCAECHMPTRTYMTVDPRHDHSIRIPRPDLSLSTGSPNACVQCHTDRDDAWALEQVRDWYGDTPQGYQAYAEALHWGDLGAPEALASLLSVLDEVSQPAIARASAAGRLTRSARALSDDTYHRMLEDDSSLVRRAAAEGLRFRPTGTRRLAASALDDPVLDVRVAAARAVAGIQGELNPPQQEAFALALPELEASLALHLDRPEARVNRALLRVEQGRRADAESELLAALRLAPGHGGASVNLADLYRATGREARAEAVLREAVSANPGDPVVRHALGLALVRKGDLPAALEQLGKAASTAPDNARFGYVYAVALEAVGELDRAVGVLESLLERRPYEEDVLYAATIYNLKGGDFEVAKRHARSLDGLGSLGPETRALVERLLQDDQRER